MLGSRDQDTSLLLYNSGECEIATCTIRKQPQFDLGQGSIQLQNQKTIEVDYKLKNCIE
jgi:hypothetical protein